MAGRKKKLKSIRSLEKAIARFKANRDWAMREYAKTVGSDWQEFWEAKALADMDARIAELEQLLADKKANLQIFDIDDEDGSLVEGETADSMRKELDKLVKERDELARKFNESVAHSEDQYNLGVSIRDIEWEIEELREKFQARRVEEGELDADFTNDGDFAPDVISSAPPIDLSFAEVMKYSSPHFEQKFKDSIEDWCDDAKATITILRTHMIPEGGTKDSPSDLSHGAAIGMLQQVLKAWPNAITAASALRSMLPVLKAALGENLPTQTKGIGLTYAQLTMAWASSIDSVKNDDYTSDFRAFLDEYKSNPANITTDLTQWEHDFFSACADYKITYMPSTKETKDAFIAALIKALADAAGTDDTKGAKAELYWKWIGLHDGLTGGSGRLYLTDGLKNVIKTEKSGARLIDLPIEIFITVENITETETVFKAERSMAVPGSEEFNFVKGDKAAWEVLKDQKLWRDIVVSDLM